MLRTKQLTKLIKNLPKYSYSKFVLENPVRHKVDRQNAVKRFLDSTRETSAQETSENQSLNSK